MESSLLLDGGEAVLIDVTRDFSQQAKALTGIDAVLLTHGHRDASGGMAKLGAWCRRRRAAPVAVYASDATIAVVRDRFARLDHCRLIAVHEAEPVRIGSWSALALEVPHARAPRYRTFAWKLRRRGRTVVYASDVAGLTDRLQRFCRGADLLVVDAAMWRRQIFSHLTIDEALPELCRWEVEHIVLTQIGRLLPPHELLEDEVARRCARARPAYDGLELAL
jgi:phosphoribosyl 1,2-cyclic phosphodiesterase